MAAMARHEPNRRKQAAAAVAAMLPLVALAIACLDGVLVLAASQLISGAAGLR
jgi:hypothetical protein